MTADQYARLTPDSYQWTVQHDAAKKLSSHALLSVGRREKSQFLAIFQAQIWFSLSNSATASDGGLMIAHLYTTHQALSTDMPHTASIPSIPDLDETSIFCLSSQRRA